MNQFKSSLSKLAAMAAVLGTSACGGSNQAQPSTPSSAQTAPPEQGAAAMGQPAGGGETNAMGSSQPSGTSPSPSGAAQSGAPETMGTSGSMGTESTGASGSASGSRSGAPGSPETQGAPSTMGSATDTSGLSDAQLAGVLQAINQAQIQRALLGQSKATSPEVKRLAHEMVAAYRAVQTKEASLFAKLQMPPADSPVSTYIKTDAQNELTTLQGMRGKDFDRSYTDAEVRHLNNALEMADHMMSDAKNPEFKSELQRVHAKIEGHVRDAERVQQGLEKTGP